MRQSRSFRNMLLMFLLLVSMQPVFAADDQVTISLQGRRGDSVPATVTLEQIERLGAEDITINDPFEKKTNTFHGVRMEKLVDSFGGPGIDKITISGIDGYQVSFEREFWRRHRLLFATRVNGEYFDYDRKGPMRVIFPYYDPETHISKEILPLWIWMITEITMH